MNDLLFSVFPNENFVDIGLYQYGWEHCAPAHSFGPAARNHYIFHYVISGTGTLMADNSAGETTLQIPTFHGSTPGWNLTGSGQKRSWKLQV